MAGKDFIDVQLTAAGVKYAGAGGVVGVYNGRREFKFTAGQPAKVLKAYEWDKVLATMKAFGEPMFEIVQYQAPVLAETENLPEDK
jgi:hypothetical protein